MFHFKRFSLEHENSTLKIGTDAVLLALLTDIGGEASVLDLGCGCGVVAFCAAQRYADNGIRPTIHGIDIDADSVAESERNAANFCLVHRSCFVFENTSFQEFAEKNEPGSIDLILTNPPYFHNCLLPSEKTKLRSKHGDGNLTFEEILLLSKRLLSENGRLSIILPKAESETFTCAAEGVMFCNRKVYIHPTAAKPANRVVMEFSKKCKPFSESDFSILGENHNHTAEYLDLTKPFLTLKKK